MLMYTMSADGHFAMIQNCVGANVRLSIIRLSRELEIEIPECVLDKETDMDTLRELNIELLIERHEVRMIKLQEKRARDAEQRAEQEQRMSEEVVTRVSELRAAAARIRTAAQYADDMSVYGAEMAEAARLERHAEALMASC